MQTKHVGDSIYDRKGTIDPIEWSGETGLLLISNMEMINSLFGRSL